MQKSVNWEIGLIFKFYKNYWLRLSKRKLRIKIKTKWINVLYWKIIKYYWKFILKRSHTLIKNSIFGKRIRKFLVKVSFSEKLIRFHNQRFKIRPGNRKTQVAKWNGK